MTVVSTHVPASPRATDCRCVFIKCRGCLSHSSSIMTKRCLSVLPGLMVLQHTAAKHANMLSDLQPWQNDKLFKVNDFPQ